MVLRCIMEQCPPRLRAGSTTLYLTSLHRLLFLGKGHLAILMVPHRPGAKLEGPHGRKGRSTEVAAPHAGADHRSADSSDRSPAAHQTAGSARPEARPDGRRTHAAASACRR